MKPNTKPFTEKVARVVSNTCNHEFSIGTKVLLKDNEDWEYEDDCELIAVSIANEEDWWYMKIADIQLIGEPITYTIDQLKEKCWQAYQYSNTVHLPFSRILRLEFNDWWEANKP
jgi:hypothetical protein